MGTEWEADWRWKPEEEAHKQVDWLNKYDLQVDDAEDTSKWKKYDHLFDVSEFSCVFWGIYYIVFHNYTDLFVSL